MLHASPHVFKLRSQPFSMTAAVTLTALGCSFHSLSCMQFWCSCTIYKRSSVYCTSLPSLSVVRTHSFPQLWVRNASSFPGDVAWMHELMRNLDCPNFSWSSFSTMACLCNSWTIKFAWNWSPKNRKKLKSPKLLKAWKTLLLSATLGQLVSTSVLWPLLQEAWQT